MQNNKNSYNNNNISSGKEQDKFEQTYWENDNPFEIAADASNSNPFEIAADASNSNPFVPTVKESLNSAHLSSNNSISSLLNNSGSSVNSALLSPQNKKNPLQDLVSKPANQSKSSGRNM